MSNFELGSCPGFTWTLVTPLSMERGFCLSLLPVLPQGRPVHACTLCGWPFRVEWTSIGAAIAPRIHSDTFYSSLKTVLVSPAGIGCSGLFRGVDMERSPPPSG